LIDRRCCFIGGGGSGSAIPIFDYRPTYQDEKNSVMVGPKASSLLSVPVLLNEAQKSAGNGQIRYAKLVWETVEGGVVEEAVHQLCTCLKWIVVKAEVRCCGFRLLFFGVCVCACGGGGGGGRGCSCK